MTTPIATAYVLIEPNTAQFTAHLRAGLDEALSGVKSKVAETSKSVSDSLTKAAATGGKGLSDGVHKGTESAKKDLTGLGKLGEEIFGKLKEAAAGLVALEAIKKVGEAFLGAGEQVEGLSHKIIAATGAAGPKLEELDKIGQGLADQLPASFADIGDAVGKLNAGLGLTGKPLADLATKFLDLQKITGTALDIPTTTAALTGFGVAAKDQGAVLEQFFATSQRTGVGIADLVAGVKSGAPALHLFGLSAVQSANLLGGLQRNGLDAERVTTGLRVAFSKFSKEGRPAQAALVDTVKKMKAFIDTGNTPKAATLAAKIFGTRGAAAFTAAVQSGALSVASLTANAAAAGKPIENTEKRTRTLGDALKILGNNINDKLGPSSIKTLEFLQVQVEKLTKAFHSPETKRFVTEIKANLIPALHAFGEFMSTTVVPAVKNVTARIGRDLRPVLTELGNAFRKDIVPALASLAGHFQNALPAIKKIGNLFLDLQEIVAKLAPYLIAVYAKYFAGLIRVGGTVGEKIYQLTGFVAGLADGLIKLVEKTGPAIKGFADLFLSAIGIMLDGIQHLLDAAGHIPLVGGKFRDMADAVGQARGSVLGLKANIDSLSDKTVTITLREVTIKQQFLQKVNPGASISTGPNANTVVGPVISPDQQAAVNRENAANRAAAAAAAARAAADLAGAAGGGGGGGGSGGSGSSAAKDAAKAAANDALTAAKQAAADAVTAAKDAAKKVADIAKTGTAAATAAAKSAAAALKTGSTQAAKAAAKDSADAARNAKAGVAVAAKAAAAVAKAALDASRARTKAAADAAAAEARAAAKAAATATKAAAADAAAAIKAAKKAAADLAVAVAVAGVAKQVTARKFVDSITGGADAINAAFDKLVANLKAANAPKLAAYATKLRGQLLAKGAARDLIADQLKVAQDGLDALTKTASDFADTVRAGIVETGNVATHNTITFVGIRNSLRNALAEAKAFTAAIAKLTAAGLNQTGLQQLVAAGPEQGLAAARAILSGGQAGIDAVNTLQGQLDAAGAKLGAATADTFYTQGINLAKALVDGLASQQSVLEAQMVKLANTLVTTLKNGLGIHSRSKIGFEVGLNVGSAIAAGIATAAPAVAAANRSLTQINLGGVTVNGVADAAAARTAGTVVGAGVADALARNRLVAALAGAA